MEKFSGQETATGVNVGIKKFTVHPSKKTFCCDDINFKFRYATCEPPSCPEEDWVYNEKFNCCPKCRDFARFCAVKPCHKYATCTDSKRGPKCSCDTVSCFQIFSQRTSLDVIIISGLPRKWHVLRRH